VGERRKVSARSRPEGAARIDYGKMAKHISRACKPNLKRNCKCCQGCPFLSIIRAYMKDGG